MKPPARSFSHRQRVSWLRLIRTPNVGPASFRDLINRFGSAESALEMLPELASSGGARSSLRIPTEAEAEAELERAESHGARIVAIGEPDYPPLLKRMPHPPPLLSIRGSAEVFAKPAVAIVGARNASVSGMKLARILASDLGRAGFSVASGLARGIDTAAHEGSLASGTIAVLAGGLDRPYPPENIALMERIAAEGGAVISEMPFGWQARAQDFPRRNRIVAGISFGLIVVEAAERSGSLISARLAGDFGRLVFAVPGSPLDPRAAGANRLLKDGATLVTEAQDVIDAIRPLTGDTIPLPFAMDEAPDIVPVQPYKDTHETSEGVRTGDAVKTGDSGRIRLIEALGPTPISVDDLIRHTGFHPAQIADMLLELDLAGQIERHSGGSVSLLI